MIRYAQNTDSWEDWQLDYRLGLILIMPPKGVSDLIDPLRERYDPKSHATCSTHISVSDPLSLEMTPDLETEIRAILQDFQPFELHFRTLHASSKHPGVSYSIHPEEPIRALQEALHKSRAFAGKVYKRRHIPPHMTIAEFISIQESLKLCDQLQDTAPKGSFICDRLEFIVPDDNMRWHREITFMLGSSET